MTANKFWETKPLQDYTAEEWESICSRCGQCCLIKLQDEDGGEVYYTNVVCRYFNSDSHCCSEYNKRCTLVPSCLRLTPQNLDKIDWIPDNCAYNILRRTGKLPDWHPLITGKPLDKKYAIGHNVISELLVKEEDLEDHIIEDENDD